MRKFVGVGLIAVLGALVLPMAAASAQFIPGEGAPPTPGCVITGVSPTVVASGSFTSGVTVTVTGTLSAPATLTLFAAPGVPPTGPPVVLATQAVGAGAFSISGVVFGPSTITLGITYGPQDAYAAACAAVGGVSSFSVQAESVTVVPAPTAAAALAFTGSSDTPSYVLIGIAAVVIGAVLVVAARRRKQIS